MASQPKLFAPLSPEEPPLSREEGFALLFSLYGCLHETYEEQGGVEAIIRSLDEPDHEEPSA
jgi:hypothetical protein